jgi:hypothetical protein
MKEKLLIKNYKNRLKTITDNVLQYDFRIVDNFFGNSIFSVFFVMQDVFLYVQN